MYKFRICSINKPKWRRHSGACMHHATAPPSCHNASRARLSVKTALRQHWHAAAAASHPFTASQKKKHTMQQSPKELRDEWPDLHKEAAVA